MTDDFHSDFLFATPTFIEGAGRLLDFGNSLTEYNRSATSDVADRRALTQDWLAVGADITRAISTFVQDVVA